MERGVEGETPAVPAEGFAAEDFAEGGRCFPPHPVFPDDSLFVLELGEEDEVNWQSVSEAVEDFQAVMAVLAGRKSLEELTAEWGLDPEEPAEETAEPVTTG